jgi:hypothetical protein
VSDNQKCPAPPVTYNPAVLTPYLPYSTQTVTATAGGVSLQAQTYTVNENAPTGTTKIATTTFEAIAEKCIKAIDAILEETPCKPKGNKVPSGNLSYASSYMCCPADQNCVKTSRKYGGSAKWNYGFTCHFPIYGCPFVASLDAVLSANASFAIGLSYKTGCTTGKICTNVDAGISLGGGVGATVLAGLGSAELQLICSSSIKATWCFYPQIERPTGNINVGAVKIEGTVSGGWGLVSHTVEFTFFNGFNIPF